jgi:hypothetical protein
MRTIAKYSQPSPWIGALVAACLVPRLASAQDADLSPAPAAAPPAVDAPAAPPIEPLRGATAAERARTVELASAAGEIGRDQRVRDGAEALGVGVAFAGIGVASWATASDPDARKTRDVLGGVFVGTGGLLVLGGALAFAARSDLEVHRDTFFSTVRANPAAFDAATRELERGLFAEEKAAKAERTVTAVTSFVFGAAEIAGGIAIEATAEDPGLRWLGRSLVVAGAASGIMGTGALMVRSETERIADLWRSERRFPDARGRSSLTVTPQLGMGSVGLAGTF